MTGSDCTLGWRPRLARLAGGATAQGVELEQKVAGLAALRARRRGARFRLFSNVAAARPLDDLVLRLAPPGATYFLQLKHTGVAPLSLKTFTMSKNFCLKKYFDFFLKLRSWHQIKLDPGGALTDEERLLCEGPMEQCRFVIFTTQQRWKAASICNVDDGYIHKMARCILNTGATDDCVLRFTHNDRKIWDLLKGDENEEIYQKEFLPNLLVFCEQCESGQLDSFIKLEIQELLGEALPQLDLLTFRFLGFLKEWMQDDAKDFCLTEDSAEVEWFLAEHLRAEARKACALDVLQFEEAHRGPLRDALRQNGALVLQAWGVPAGARAAKLLGLLSAERRGAWVYANSDVLSQFDAKALVAVCGAHHCQVLVVDVDYNSKNLNDLLLAVSGDVKIVCFVKINLGSVPVTTHEDELTFSQLTEDAQTRLLERTIKFQGQPVRLRELEGAWPGLRAEADGALLGAAALGGAALGGAWADEDDEGGERRLYIPRSLHHPSALDPAALRIAPAHDHLVLTGLPPRALRRLRQALGWPLDEMNDRWTVLENSSLAKIEAAFNAVSSKLSSRNVHWVECLAPPDDNSALDVAALPLVWRRSRGRGDALAALVRPATAACARAPACVHEAARAPGDAAAWGARGALLVGPPGAGKTCFMRRAAAEARRTRPARWAVLVHAQAHRRVLNAMPPATALTLAHLEQLLAEAAGAGTSRVATMRSLQAALRTGAVGVFIDGVDELCPAFKDKVLRLLQLLLRDTKAAPVWVSSRPEVQASLLRVLGGPCVSLTRGEQCQFLTTRFGRESQPCGTPARESAERLLDAIANHVPEDTEAGSLFATPLHLKMVAEIFLDAEAAGSTESGWALELYELFQKFVRRKEDEYLEKHGFRNANLECAPFYKHDYFSQIHQNCAMILLVSDKRFEDVDPHPFQAYVDENRETLQKMKTGVMWLDDDRAPRFVHYTLVEYFAAAWLSANVASERAETAAAARAVARCLIAKAAPGGGGGGGGGGGVLLHFLDEMLAERLTADRAELAGNHTDTAGTREDKAGLEGAEAPNIGSPNVVELLLAPEADAGAGSGQGKSSLHLAAVNGLAACARALCREAALVHGTDEAGRTPLHDAAGEGHRRVLEVLCNAGADVNARTPDGDTALALSADEGHLGCVVLLASRGAAVAAADARGWTALHRAAARGRLAVALALLDGGASTNASALDGATPLALAAAGGHAHCAEQLLKRGADVGVVDGEGMTALHSAARGGHLHVVYHLLKGGAEVDARCAGGRTPLALALTNGHANCAVYLLKGGAEVDAADAAGRTPLHQVAQRGFVRLVDLLLKAEADVHARTADGETALALAAAGGHTHCVNILLLYGADVRARDAAGQTPLHAAARGRHLDAVYRLLRAGASVNARDDDGKTPLQLAAGDERLRPDGT